MVFDLRAGYKLARQHEIIVDVENLADKKYSDLQGAATLRAVFDVCLEDALEQAGCSQDRQERS